MKIWCFIDPQDWGRSLAMEAAKRGHDAHLFEIAADVDEGYCFVHMHHHPVVKTKHKRIVKLISTNPDVIMIPSYQASTLFDDKLEQACVFTGWMPKTRIYYTPHAARNHMARHGVAMDPRVINPPSDMPPNPAVFPFISKASNGSGAEAIRMIKNAEHARAEIKGAFSDTGLKSTDGQLQHGYLLWQDFVHGSVYDLRIICIGNTRAAVRRFAKYPAHRPISSNYSHIEQVTELDDETDRAFHFVDQFLAAHPYLKFCQIDLVRNTEGRFYVLEVSVSWPMDDWRKAVFFQRGVAGEYLSMTTTGKGVWKITMDQIERGAFG